MSSDMSGFNFLCTVIAMLILAPFIVMGAFFLIAFIFAIGNWAIHLI
jgi:hypothetical protein